ncbi:uncharacterized protein BDZ99DRAFT_478866 [Mytilinidion resinicola]|uniref:RING-type domain-containing protein n=1 Tax=Mytilinidion resinicola TaxID=574789 RepID=A0A6A6YF66_9PEZI|nr:uncharacterized protein BDZ99DRAFT_478866 [Mytilinidion resinicola]KAF2807380.1 hypothetical protein BDZ99DRAFT_478866 [Mytilinidion resinicola]
MYSKREFLRYGITECDDENPPKEPECPICHLEYGTTDNDTPAEHAIRIEHCEHTFGSECYRQWIMPTNQRYTTGDGQRNACPMCKAVLFAPPWYNRDDEVPSDIEMASDSEESSDSEDAEAAQDSHTYDPNRVYPRRSASPEENAHLRRVYTLYHMRMANLDEIEAQRLLLGAHDVEQKELDRRDAAEKLPDNPIEAERVRIQREARRVVAERKRDGLVFNICAKEARNARLLREEADERLAVEEVTWRQKVDDEGEEHSERRQPGFRVLPGGRLR